MTPDEQAGVQVKAQAGAQANEQADTQVKASTDSKRRRKSDGSLKTLQNLLGRSLTCIPELETRVQFQFFRLNTWALTLVSCINN